MTEQAFSLIPFPGSHTPDLIIHGHAGRQNNLLMIQYLLLGETGKLLLPKKSTVPMRKDGLWAATCFEIFLALPNNPQYWEFNVSPSGDWNVYRMDAYRRVGFREEVSIQRLQLEAQNETNCFSVKAAVDLSPLIPQDHPIELGISSVIQTFDGHESYWALAHPDAQADFHIRDSFLIHL